MNVFDIFGRKQHRVLGIDISSESVKIIEISSSKEEHTVEGYGFKSLPENAVEGSSIKDINAVANCIRAILSESKLSSKKAVIAVPDSHAISHIVQAHEGMDDDEIEEMVVMEADKYIPYPIEEVNLDFTMLGTSKKNTAMKDVLVVASRTENVMNRVNVINEAGLEPLVVDVESFAIERAAQYAYEDELDASEKKLLAVIDIGAVFTRFYVLSSSKIIFSREEEFGGNQLIQSIMHAYDMNQEEAKSAYFANKLPEGYVQNVLEPFKELILLQVKRGLQFFFSSMQFSQVDHVLLAGGVAKLEGISELIEEHVNVPISIANPFKHMIISGRANEELIKKDSPRLMVPCGLALRANTKMLAR